MILRFQMRDRIPDFDFPCQEGITLPAFCRQMVQSGGVEFEGSFYPLASIDVVSIKRDA